MTVSNYIKFSMCDILKKGIGSSSSHTLAPWLSAKECHKRLKDSDDIPKLKSIVVQLFGSLAYVGRGHYTSIAIPLGLLGKDPSKFDINEGLKPALGIDDIRKIDTVKLLSFDEKPNVPYTIEYYAQPIEDKTTEKMKFFFTLQDRSIVEYIFYSYGGGSYGETDTPPELYEGLELNNRYSDADDLLELLTDKTLDEVIYENEIQFANYRKGSKKPIYDGLPKSEAEIVPYLHDLAQQMGKLIFDGCCHDDKEMCYAIMFAKPRAKIIFNTLFDTKECQANAVWTDFFIKMKKNTEAFGFEAVTDLISMFALAVSEQNAALKNVVTAPTNGACGTVPAVLFYYIMFHAPDSERTWLYDDNVVVNSDAELNKICKFLLIANAIGGVVKANANIAGGIGGCQAEIGTASAMAAGALTAVLGGDGKQIFQAAEAALEHHLGSTCDPVGGLVEIPCIERNLTAAITAISVSLEILALKQGFETVVSFDEVVKTMKHISKHMEDRYKETSTGGLAKTMLYKVKEERPDLYPQGAPNIAEGQTSVVKATC